MYNNEYLKHYGVLGMHWGRKTGTSKAISSTSKKNKNLNTNIHVSEDHANKVELKKKNVKELTNAELKSLTTRLQLEKQYKDLNPKELNKGMKVVKDVTAVGTTLASLYALTKTPLYQDISKAVKATQKVK